MKKIIFLLILILGVHALVNAQNIYTTAGTGADGYTGDGGAATLAQISYPLGVHVDGIGNVFFADCYNNCIRKINTAGIITTIAGTGTADYSGDGGPALLAELNRPRCVTTDGAGNVYISDNNRIRKIDVAGIITTIAGTGTASYSGDGGPAVSAELSFPVGIAIDDTGNIYISDGNNHIRKIDTSGTIITIAGTATAGYTGDGSAATAAEIDVPTGIAVDGIGNVYFADEGNSCIRRINPLGIINTIAGDGSSGYSGDGGDAALARLSFPYGIALDGSGNLYICDVNNSNIRKVDRYGIITTIAGNGIMGYSGDDIAATAAEFFYPVGISVSATGKVYIADEFNSRIRVIIPETAPYFADGAMQAETLCPATAFFSLNADLAVIDADAGQTETWSLITAPLHGFASVAYTDTSTGDTLMPAGLSYTPATGYSGSDSFIVMVSDGIDSAFTTIYTTITPVPVAGAITGVGFACAGSTIILTETATGGTWSSSNAAVATVSGGVVTGIAAGAATVSYIAANACGSDTATKEITVNPLPAAGAITGLATVCAGSTITLADTAAVGIWSSSTAAAAVSGGVVTGISASMASISYTVTNSCGTAMAVKTIMVNPLPASGIVIGAASVCAGSTITLTDAAIGGTWSSSNAAIATVSGGAVTGIAAGAATISYIITNTCGSDTTTKEIIVSPLPTAGAINGLATVCAGSAITLADTAAGGIWSSSSAAATVSGGIVTGITAGTATISYTVTNTCSTAVAIKTITVNPLPAAGTVTGAASVCAGSVTTLSDASAGGIWSSSNAAVATVSGGVVSGILAGTAVISYTVTNSCGTASAIKIITVSSLPDAGTITGASTVCAGSAISLTDIAAGGTWASSNAAVATVISGVISGMAAGTATISYIVTNTCGTDVAVKVITVGVLPDAGTITGPAEVCTGGTITLTDTAAGGTWGASNGNAAVSGGVVSAIAGGVDTIIYTFTNACGTIAAAKAIVIITPPAVSISSLPFATCTGTSVVLSGAPAGGIWLSSDSLMGAVSLSGAFTAVAPGTVTLKYAVTIAVCGTSYALQTDTVLTDAECGGTLGVLPLRPCNDINAYPNPSDGMFTVEVPLSYQPTSIRIMDMYGKLVKEQNIEPNAGTKAQFDLRNVARGTYLIRVSSGDNIYQEKVVVW